MSESTREIRSAFGTLIQLAETGTVPLTDLQAAVGTLKMLEELNMRLIFNNPALYPITPGLGVRPRGGGLELLAPGGEVFLDLRHVGKLLLVVQHLWAQARQQRAAVEVEMAEQLGQLGNGSLA